MIGPGSDKNPQLTFFDCVLSASDQDVCRCCGCLHRQLASLSHILPHLLSVPSGEKMIAFHIFFCFQIFTWLPHYLVFLMFCYKLQKVMVAWFTRDTFLLCYWLAMVRASSIITGWGWYWAFIPAWALGNRFTAISRSYLTHPLSNNIYFLKTGKHLFRSSVCHFPEQLCGQPNHILLHEPKVESVLSATGCFFYWSLL